MLEVRYGDVVYASSRKWRKNIYGERWGGVGVVSAYVDRVYVGFSGGGNSFGFGLLVGVVEIFDG